MDQLNDLMALFVPVSFIVFGLVEFFKTTFKLQGTAVTAVSFVVGAVVGGGVFAAWLYPAAQVYVYGTLFVLAAGLVSSGYYKFAAARTVLRSEWIKWGGEDAPVK